MRIPIPSRSTRRRAGPALLGLLLLLVGFLPPLAVPATAAPAYYRAEIRDGRWWYVQPDGAAAFSMGVNYVNPGGMVARDGTNP